MELLGLVNYALFMAIFICIYALLALGLNIQWGLTGLFNAGIAGFFAALTGGDSLPQRKPDPAPLHHTAGLLQAELSAVIYVGDSEVDAATAAAAGVPFLLFTEGYRKTPVAEIAHHAALSRFAELPGVLAALAQEQAS